MHKGKRGVQLARTSKAKYRFEGQPNIPALKQGLMVYDALKEVEGIKPKRPQWEIAQELRTYPRLYGLIRPIRLDWLLVRKCFDCNRRAV